MSLVVVYTVVEIDAQSPRLREASESRTRSLIHGYGTPIECDVLAFLVIELWMLEMVLEEKRELPWIRMSLTQKSSTAFSQNCRQVRRKFNTVHV